MAALKNNIYSGTSAPANKTMYWIDTRATKRGANIVKKYIGGRWRKVSDELQELVRQVANDANAATTLAGYGITDAYTKAQVDSIQNVARPLHDLFIELGATYSSTSGKYTLGSTELTYAEVLTLFVTENELTLTEPQGD
jgi:hypothetical protein